MNDITERLSALADKYLTRRTLTILVIALVLLAFWGGAHYQDWRAVHGSIELANAEPSSEAEAEQEKSPAPKEVVVHVAGAVKHPGVYTLAADKRVNDAVRAAEVLAEADLSQLNLAQHLADGQKIVVPIKGQAAPATSATATPSTTPDDKVNLNTASLEELSKLPNIGQVRAQAIINYRTEKGGFTKIEELKNISGIGEKTFAELADRVTL